MRFSVMASAALVAVCAGSVATLAIGQGGSANLAGPDENPGVVAFESPTGNLRCVMARQGGHASVRCVSLTPRRAARIVAGKRARQVPFGQVGSLRSAEPLPYGEAASLHRFTCRSRPTGIACVDARTRNGFRISRERVVVFGPRATARPAPAQRPAPGPSDRYNCDDFPLADGTTAQQYLDRFPSDPSGLDADANGLACESQ